MKIKFVRIILCLCCALMMSACGIAKKPTGVYKTDVSASYYHDKFNGRKTASGAIFNNNKLTTAHPSLPFGTQLKVTNRANGKSVIVTVTDRGPFTKGRELDLTKRAFMGITDNKIKGVLQVDIEIVKQ